VAQEHEVSALVRDVLGEVAARLPSPSTSRGAIVAACVPGEGHELGLRMAAMVAQALGYAVHYLGANVPVASILYALRSRRASTLLLSVTLDEHLPALDATLRSLAVLAPAERPAVLVGGQAAARLPAANQKQHVQVILDLPALVGALDFGGDQRQ
jgi:methanogenic corrinoid protein MtbC1